MGGIKKNKLTRWLVISILSIVMVLITMKIGITAVFSDKNSDEGMEQVQASVLPLAGVSENAIKLKGGEGGNVDSITLYYLVGNTWVEITEENSSNIPANAAFQLEITYHSIDVNELIEAGGQLVFEDYPAWFRPAANGVILYEGEIAGRIAEVDGKIVITFDPGWLKGHAGKVLSGSFKISGSIDWHQLPDDGTPSSMPNLNIELNFETGLAQKYGNVQIEKSEPELIQGSDGKYYLKYELTVTSLESLPIPDVWVKDRFTNVSYIEKYVGVGDIDALPGEDAGNFNPWEKREENYTEGSLSIDGSSMLWNIGELQPGETRTLTYYAEIAETFIDSVAKNSIQNKAELYAGKEPDGEYLKDVDQKSFTPGNDVKLTKGKPDVKIGPTGDGTISYTITITASENNSFTMKGLTLKDYFLEDLSAYLSGGGAGGKQLTVTTMTTAADGETETVSYSVSYENASFELDNLELEPGSVMTITYEIQVKNIFFYNNGDVTLTNTASIGKGDRTLSTGSNKESLEKQTWTRKMVGEPLEEKLQITMDPTDSVYDYNGNQMEEMPGGFTVPAESLKYQVVLNESGQWDLSSTTMTDRFDSDYLKYVGYVQIQLFERKEGASNDLSDQELVGELNGLTPAKTIWLKIDGEGNFSFKPEQLGLGNDKNYTYLLTYYAKPQNMDDVGSVQITNHFKLDGTVGLGNGNGTIDLPGIEISVGKVVQGGIKYDAEKITWYYEDDPWEKDENGKSTVEIWEDGTLYANGALYWIVKLEGTIPNGLIVKDTASTNMQFCYDSIPFVYKGPKSFDWTHYRSFGDFLNNNNLTPLVGNKYNGRYTKETKPEDLPEELKGYYDYWWQLDSRDTTGPLSLTFKKGFSPDGKDECNLGEEEAIYIVIRTNPKNNTLPTGSTTATTTYTNSLSIKSGNDEFPVNSTDNVIKVKSALYKESKGAYFYNKEDGSFDNWSNRQGGDWHPESSVNQELLPSSGIYAAWLLNVNWDGSMSGTYDVVDYLPEGMELVYVDVNNYGKYAKTSNDKWPTTEYIPELSNSGDWNEMTQDGLTTGNQQVTTISYYNPNTREVRWRISNLQTGGYKDYEINLRIICKVTDYELFLSGKGKTYVNEAAILDPITQEPSNLENADVTITVKIDKNLDEAVLQALGGIKQNNNSIHGVLNQVPFKIEINPWGLDMCEGDVLPALIDELSPGLELIEDSLTVTIVDGSPNGTPYVDFTHTVREQDGKQILIIEGLPDETPMTITYKIKVDAAPNEQVTITNIAYWAGNPPPNNPQVGGLDFSYDASGEVFTADDINVEITKVDADSHSKKLKGATFKLYEVTINNDDTLSETEIRISDATDSKGKVTFNNKGTAQALKLNTVYCIREENAPNGYIADKEGHYFIIVDPDNREAVADYKEKIPNLKFVYDSPDYSCVIENSKEAISVEKIFKDKDGKSYTPTSGKYRFGLYDINNKLQETLTIEYVENGGPNYYLDGMPTDTPHFLKYDPECVYYIYELDSAGKPIQNGAASSINGKDYFVYYEVADAITNQVVIGSEIIITNMLTGDLTVKKTVTGAYAETGKEFTFAVTMLESNGDIYKAINGKHGDITFIDGVATFTLKHGESVTAKGLPAGIDYIVEESDNDNYDVIWSKTVGGTTSGTPDGTGTEQNTGTILSGAADTVTATNTRSKGKVTISKTTAGFAVGETVAGNEEFEFTVTMKEPDGSVIQGEFTYTIGKTGTTTPGEDSSSEPLSVKSGGKITLKPGEYATIEGLPAGAVVTATETTTGYAFDYTASYTVDNEKETNGNTASVTVDKLDATNAQAKGNEIHFVNTVKSSKLEITKAAVGQKASVSDTEEFEFTVKLTSDNGTALTGDYYYDVTDKDGKNVSSKNPLVKAKTPGEYTFKLKADQTATILNLPVGAKYEVTENDNGRYSAEYDEGNSNNISGVIAAGKTQSGTVTNIYQFGDLTVTKKVEAGTVGATDPNASFTFTITLTPPEGGTLASQYSYMKFKGSSAESEKQTLSLQENVEDGTYVGSFSLIDGESITILDLPLGTLYSVEETVPNNYEAKYSAEGKTSADLPCSGKIETPGKNIEVTVTNKRLKPVLAVEKKVSLDGKNFKDNLVVDLEDILTYQIVVTSNGDEGSVYENVVLEDVLDIDFELIEGSFACVDKDGKDVPVTPDYDKGANKIEWSLGDMPKGMEITITYQIRFLNTGNALSKNYKNIAIVQGDRDEVIVSNDPGQLIITKTVENSRGEVLENDTTKFTFTVTLTPPADIKLLSGYPYAVTDKNGDVVRQGTFKVNEETGKGTIELAHGETASIKKLPTGTIYKVDESNNPDYTKKSENHVTGTIGSKADATLNVATFVNTRNPVKAEIGITKKLTGVLPEGSEYTFAFRATLKTIDGKAVNETNGKTMQSSVTIKSADQPEEENIWLAKTTLDTELDEGVYEFEVEELDPQIDEINCDTKKYTVTITVSFNAQGELEAVITKITDEEGAGLPTDQDVVFHNKFKYYPFDVDATMNKVLEGANLKGEDFTFDYTVEYAKTKADTSRPVTIGTVANDKDGKINLKLTFDQVGIYTLTVKEDSTKGGPYQYSDNVYKVEYTVTYNDETGNMDYTSKVLSGSDTFTNKYVTDPAVIEIPVTKNLKGKLPEDGIYTIVFKATRISIDGVEIPVKSSIVSSVTIKGPSDDNKTGKTTLRITCDKAGKYVYQIEELKPADENISHDEIIYFVTIDVTDNGTGSLVYELSVEDSSGKLIDEDGIVFDNIYTKEQDTEEPTTSEEETTEDTEEPTTSEEETTEDTEEPTTQEEVTTEDTEEPTTSEEPTTEDTEEPTTQEEVTTEDTEEPTTHEEVTTEDTEEPTTYEEVTTEDTEEPTTHEEVTTEDTEEPTTYEEVTTEDTEEPTTQEEVTTEDTEEPTTREEVTTEDTEEPTTHEEEKTEEADYLTTSEASTAEDTEEPTTNVIEAGDSAPKTGDSQMTGMCFLMMLFSLLGACVVLIKRQKKM